MKQKERNMIARIPSRYNSSKAAASKVPSSPMQNNFIGPLQPMPSAAPFFPSGTQFTGRTIRFELDAPQAQAVCVAGTFNDWRPGMTPLSSQGDGKWLKELSLAPGRYEYRFFVDSTWVDDPKAKTTVLNARGTHNAILEVI